MRILVSGSRDWTDRMTVYRALNAACNAFDLNYEPDEYGNTMPDPSKITVVHGGCPSGADLIADDWCIGANFVAEVHPADWEKYGKRAGYIRNKEMVESGIDIALFFIKNESKGATMTLNLANEAGLSTRVYRQHDEVCCKRHTRWCFVSFDGDYPPEPCCPGCSANRYPADPLPLHRTEAGYPNCATCDGGGCPDCTDPA